MFTELKSNIIILLSKDNNIIYSIIYETLFPVQI